MFLAKGVCVTQEHPGFVNDLMRSQAPKKTFEMSLLGVHPKTLSQCFFGGGLVWEGFFTKLPPFLPVLAPHIKGSETPPFYLASGIFFRSQVVNLRPLLVKKLLS